MLVQGIKSRPEYKGLDIDPHAKRHLFVLEGEGAAALTGQVDLKGKDFLAKSEILFLAAGAAPKAYDVVLSALSPDIFWQAPTPSSPLLFRLRACLEQARMGTRALHRRHRRLYRPDHADGAGIRYRFQLDPYRTSRARRRAGCNACIARASPITSPPAPLPAPIAACRSWCATTIPDVSAPSRASTSMQKNRVRRLPLRRCSREPQHRHARPGRRCH